MDPRTGSALNVRPKTVAPASPPAVWPQSRRLVLGRTLSTVILVAACIPLLASQVDEARQLKVEAQQILRSASGAAADPKVYADAVRKLQKAEALLEEAAKSDPKGIEPLQEEVSSALFWAKRFANVYVADELLKPGSAGKAPEPVKAPEPAPAKGPDLSAAESAFKKAEAFESAHSGDEHAIALRWFQVADQFTGTDWSLRALTRAQEAQARYRALEAAKRAPAASLSEDLKLIEAGNVLYLEKKYTEALAKFSAAGKIADTTLVQRRIAHTHLELGYQARDQYSVQYLPLMNKYNEAVRRGDQRAAARYKAEAGSLVSRLRPLEQEALKKYTEAREAFQHGLELAKGKDLDCEAGVAILYYERKDRLRARQLLDEVLRKYKPANDEERTIFEYSRTLYKKIGGS